MEASAGYKELYKKMMKAAADYEEAREASVALDEAFPQFANEIEENGNDGKSETKSKILRNDVL